MQAWFIVLNRKPVTIWVSPKCTDFKLLPLCFLLIMTRHLAPSWWDAWQGSPKEDRRAPNTRSLGVSSVRGYLYIFVFVHTLKRVQSFSRDLSWLETNCLFISSGKWLFNHRLPDHVVVFYMLCVCVCVCLAGPAPEGDQHADSALCLPQQPVDRQRQQQPHHTHPGVVHLHAVRQQVGTRKHTSQHKHSTRVDSQFDVWTRYWLMSTDILWYLRTSEMKQANWFICQQCSHIYLYSSSTSLCHHAMNNWDMLSRLLCEYLEICSSWTARPGCSFFSVLFYTPRNTKNWILIFIFFLNAENYAVFCFADAFMMKD